MRSLEVFGQNRKCARFLFASLHPCSHEESPVQYSAILIVIQPCKYDQYVVESEIKQKKHNSVINN